MDEITTAEYKALSAEIATVRAEVAASQAALIASMAPLRTKIEEMIKAELHTIALTLEREFGASISLTAGSGPRQQIDVASLQSLERRASRTSEHIARLEDRVKSLERH